MLKSTRQFLPHCALVALILSSLAVDAAPPAFRTIATLAEAPDANALKLYVSPQGNDAWSGKLAAANAARTDGPVATVTKARDIVREIKANGLTKPITVLLRGGTHAQAKTLVFTAADSGTEACPITYQAYPGEAPIISGGQAITGWQRDEGGKLWRVQVPKTADGRKWRFNQLVVDSTRRTRARIPNKGSFLYADGPTSKDNRRSFYFREGDMKEWGNLRDAIVVVYHSWETSIHHIRQVDTEACQVSLREAAPWPMGRWTKQQRYYVENVFEGLDEPGEWYLNQVTGMLYYYPLPGEKMDEIQATAPTVTATLVDFKGNPAKDEFIEFLNFRGLSFQHTNANLRRIRNPGQGEIYQPGLIQASGLRNSTFESCEIAHTGAHGIWLGSGCADNLVERCHVHSLSGGGVYIGGGWGIRESTPTERNVVDNNFIHEGGHLFHGAHGVWIGKSSYNQITHNEISNFDYSGISCGWSWGFAPTTAHHNNLDYNHIHHLSNGEGLSDMGGIYTLGVSPGTTERYNHIHDVYNYTYVSHGSGIYPDEGSTGILIENNVVYRVDTCPLFMHYGSECIVSNNVLALGDKGLMRRCREDKRCHYEAVGNIVYGDTQNMLVGPWKNDDWKVGRNVYWSTAGEPSFAGMDFATWQPKGKDEGSIVADPMFVDPANGDFSLKPGSPALKLGFKPIDLSNTGLYGDPQWAALPKQYKDRVRNELPKPVAPPFILNLDFEGGESGGQPIDGSIVTKGNAKIAISDKAAASGQQSLAFTDAEGLAQNWMPHLFYKKAYTDGKVQLSWDMMNTKDAPASFYVEVREYKGGAYVVGPTVTVQPDGKVTASGQGLGTIPLGAWAHVDIAILLGKDAPKTYQLTLTVPNQEATVVTLPYGNAAFREVHWLGISSTSETTTTFYLDNIKMGTAEELAQPIKRRKAARRAARKKPRKPANNQQLQGYWKLDEGDGYTTADSSGYKNDGEIWATWATGSFGSAVYCDAGASHVAVQDDPTLQMGTDDFTIELWLCPTQLAIDTGDKRRRLLSKNAYPKTWMTLDITPAGIPLLQIIDANTVSCHTKGKGTIPENAWTHLAIVVDRANRKVNYYLNGVLDTTQGVPAEFKGSLSIEGNDLTIGSTWQSFIGLLDEVKIYKRALPAAEVKASYAKEKGNRTSAEYKLVE
jgi:hypothetical protein